MADQFYGDRTGTLVDPFGHVWSIATHVEDVSPEEIDRRFAKMTQAELNATARRALQRDAAQPDTAYTLFGTKGSGSAAVEAALTLLGEPFRSVDAASWEPGPGRDELQRVNPLVPDSHARAARRLGADRKRGDPHPPGPRASGKRAAAGGCRAARAGAARSRLHRRELLRGDRRHRLSGALVQRRRRGHAQAHQGRLDARGCITCGTCSPTRFPRSRSSRASSLGALDLLAAVVSKWSGSRKHLAASRPGLQRACSRGSKAIRAWRRCSRATGHASA